LVALVVIVVVVVDFGQRLAASQRLIEDANKAGTEVAVLETEQAALRTQVAYATTDAAVVQWALEHGRMVRPGEQLVVPILPTAQATAVPPPQPLPPPPPNWTLWWQMFFEQS
jgi:hypothetical protein